MFDSEMKMDVQVRHVCSSAWHKLYNIGKIRHYLTVDQTKMVVHAYVTSKLDYNNTLLYDISKRLSNRLQLVQNAAAKLITRKKKFDHVTPLLEELHWLPVQYRIIFKMMLICFKALHGTGPLYIKDMLTIAKPKGGYNFRWSKDTLLFEQPSTRLVTYGDRSFSAAAPRHWNKLPLNIRESATVSTFVTSLKTHFFKLAYKWMTFPPTAYFWVLCFLLSIGASYRLWYLSYKLNVNIYIHFLLFTNVLFPLFNLLYSVFLLFMCSRTNVLLWNVRCTKCTKINYYYYYYKPLMTRRAINSEIHLHTPTSRQCSKRCLLV